MMRAPPGMTLRQEERSSSVMPAATQPFAPVPRKMACRARDRRARFGCCSLSRYADISSARVIKILGIARRSIRLHLNQSDHVHVVDPVASLAGEGHQARGSAHCLSASSLPRSRVLLWPGFNVNFERNRAEDGQVYMLGLRNKIGIRYRRADQSAESVVSEVSMSPLNCAKVNAPYQVTDSG